MNQMHSKFAVATNLGGAVNSLKGRETLQIWLDHGAG